jgi:hypothetical protein
VDDRPEWLTYLINEERMVRYHVQNGKTEYIEDSDDGFSYEIDFESLIDSRANYAGFSIEDSDGTFVLKDSDWDAVLTWSL